MVVGELVDVTGSVEDKIQASYKGGPLNLKTNSAVALTGTGQVSGDPYDFRGKGGRKMSSPTTLSGMDIEINAMTGDPIPGIDAKLGKNPGGLLVQLHLEFDPTGAVTGSSATPVSLPTPSTGAVINLVQITN